MPTLRGRWFNVAICFECWDRLNPERKSTTEQRDAHQSWLEARLLDPEIDEKNFLADNRCPVCDERAHAGVYVRVTVEKLRAMRPHV